MHIGHYESSESSNIGTAVTFLLIGLGAGALAGRPEMDGAHLIRGIDDHGSSAERDVMVQVR